MDKEDCFLFVEDSSQYMTNQKTVREVLELSSTGYGLESVSEEKDGHKGKLTKENNI